MTNALRIAELAAGRNGGLIGVTFAPGKKQAGALSGTHDRDLGVDLDLIAAWNAAAVVTLTTAEELHELQIPTIGEEVRARFMEWLHLPIRDWHAPDAAFDAHWPDASLRLRSLIYAGARVLVHCKGGLGRAGTIAARLLVEMGMGADDAIALVREKRDPKAIETAEQERWVRAGRPQALGPDVDPAAIRDRAIGALLGLAVGDAVGTTIEFSAKPKRVVLHDMVGGGPFKLKVGQWTDDTSMALALADSLIAAPEFDARDLMERFVRWRRDGDYSCTGSCFDIGNTVSAALRRFERSGEPFAGSTDPNSAGNGSIMRLAPVAIRHLRDTETRRRVARDQSRTTHGAAEAVEACATLSDLIAIAIDGATLPDLVTSDAASAVNRFALGQSRSDVEGSGYVVESLHAALWAVARTSTFRDAILLAANLGRDADTTAAIAGQIAGALYGASAIPAEWLEKLAWRERIEEAATKLFDDGLGGQSTTRPEADRILWMLREIGCFRHAFEESGFEGGRWITDRMTERGVQQMPFVTYDGLVHVFMTAAYDLGWVINDLKWFEWAETPEGRRLMGDATAIAGADPQQLRKVLTTYLRADRFSEGALLNAFRSGAMARLVRRAAELSASRMRVD